MPLISTVGPQEAKGAVVEIYRDIEKAMGDVPVGMQLFAASPALLAQQWAASGYYAQHPRLSMALTSVIRMLVSKDNDCDYCIDFNAALLINHCGWTVDQVAATKRDMALSPLAANEKALLGFVLRVVNDRSTASREDIASLMKLGWSEADILDAVALGARNVAVDIIFNTFQVENAA